MTLLLCGYTFFWTVSGKLVFYLMGTTLVTHYIGIWISLVKLQCKMNIAGLHGEESHAIKKQYKKKEKRILAGGIFILVSVLAYLKYYNFFIQNANILLHGVGSQLLLEAKILVLPIGISFYTLQAIGYIIDVYWGKIDGQQHPGKVALFLGFFPQIMEGPISCLLYTSPSPRD